METQVVEPTSIRESVPATSSSKKAAAKVPSAAAMAADIIKKKMQMTPIAANMGSLPHCPSGSFAIDDLIGGTLAEDGKPKCPGYPRRHITEVFGAESSGKTTATLQAIVEVQKAGGSAMFLDYEHALDHAYAKAIGVSFDPEKLLLYQPNSVEDGMKLIYVAVKSGIDLVVVDSVASMVPKVELDKPADDPAQIGGLARAMSRFLPQMMGWMNDPKALERNSKGTAIILINQTRALISATARGGQDTNTAGGKALKFFAYLRLQFTKIRAEVLVKKNKFTGVDQRVPFGNLTQVKVIKSKIEGKQGATHNIFIRFGQGIDDALSLIDAGVIHKFVQKSGAQYTYQGASFRGKEAFRAALVANRSMFDELRKAVIKSVQAGSVAIAPGADDDDDDIDLEAEFGGSIEAAPNEEDGAPEMSAEEVAIEDDA